MTANANTSLGQAAIERRFVPMSDRAVVVSGERPEALFAVEEAILHLGTDEDRTHAQRILLRAQDAHRMALPGAHTGFIWIGCLRLSASRKDSPGVQEEMHGVLQPQEALRLWQLLDQHMRDLPKSAYITSGFTRTDVPTWPGIVLRATTRCTGDVRAWIAFHCITNMQTEAVAEFSAEGAMLPGQLMVCAAIPDDTMQVKDLQDAYRSIPDNGYTYLYDREVMRVGGLDVMIAIEPNDTRDLTEVVSERRARINSTASKLADSDQESLQFTNDTLVTAAKVVLYTTLRNARMTEVTDRSRLVDQMRNLKGNKRDKLRARIAQAYDYIAIGPEESMESEGAAELRAAHALEARGIKPHWRRGFYRRHRRLQCILELSHHLGHRVRIERCLIDIDRPRKIRPAQAQQPEIIVLVELSNLLQMAPQWALGQQIQEEGRQLVPHPIEKGLAVVLRKENSAFIGGHQGAQREHWGCVIVPELGVWHQARDRIRAGTVLVQEPHVAHLGAKVDIQGAVLHGLTSSCLGSP